MVTLDGRGRRIALWFASTVAVVVLLFTYRTSTAGPSATATPQAVGAQPPGVVTASPTSSGTTTSGAAVMVNGTIAQTRWGPVQVQVTIAGTRITEVQALIYPTENRRDQMINQHALPLLRGQALSAQSANIDGVSGATVTSDGYRESLQAALDAAHFAQ